MAQYITTGQLLEIFSKATASFYQAGTYERSWQIFTEIFKISLRICAIRDKKFNWTLALLTI
jgi:hypothetical protein